MAASRIAAATPSPPPNIHTPPTPRLGFGDSWEPFSPRKSSRLLAATTASQSASSARTPSPSANTRRARQPAVPASRARRTMPPSTTASKEKEAAAAAAAEGSHPFSGRMGVGMLPTPAKTPSKKQHAAFQNEANLAAIARNLFHTDAVDAVDAVMSSPKRPKKYTGISLESFTAIEEDEPIPIFTDSQDRVPEADNSTENPFYGDGAALPPTATEPPRRRSKRNHHVSIPGEGRQTVEEATRREDGLVYVFRGKKIFRKFEDSAAAQEEDILEGVTPGKRLTRAAIKPRLLFPRDDNVVAGSGRGGSTTDDEEAVTDIEDHRLPDDENEDEDEAAGGNEKPAEASRDSAKTPTSNANDNAVAPNTPPPASGFFGPASPPVTGRTTRSSHKAVAEELTPVKASGRAKKRSPFDSWRQTKSSATAGHKRPADALGAAVPAAAAKRSRS
ncbi:hypothetical protein SPI_04345 [Niveomyces insectorum RCEF 264]|uniref:Uncharacterized protein n=1 Tax=Niveomyces insectorum RCEF 264 TaxID=1081102 RepID=A0A167VN19_9HYPO|nr:hypothetical protein SPI_04345 [Niveomyces insectorum RCEF 264]